MASFTIDPEQPDGPYAPLYRHFSAVHGRTLAPREDLQEVADAVAALLEMDDPPLHTPVGVMPLLMLEITLSLTVAVAGGARFSTVTNAITAVGFYGVAFIGGFVEQIGGFAGITSMRTIGILVSLFSPADSMWRLAAHYMQPEIARSTGM